MEKGSFFILMGMFMKANGKMTKLTAKEFIGKPMGRCMKENEKMTCKKALAKRSGLIKADTKETTRMAKNMALGFMCEETGLRLVECGKTIKFMAKAFINGLMAESSQATGLMGKCMGLAFIHEKMEEGTKASI